MRQRPTLLPATRPDPHTRLQPGAVSIARSVEGVPLTLGFAQQLRVDHDQPSVVLNVLHSTRLNVMLIGDRCVISTTIGSLLDQLSPPVCNWAFEQPLPSGDPATVVIRDVTSLSNERQREWLAWLDRRIRIGTPQMITTNSVAVFPLIAAGMFREDLYYRLNSVLLDLAEISRWPASA